MNYRVKIESERDTKLMESILGVNFTYVPRMIIIENGTFQSLCSAICDHGECPSGGDCPEAAHDLLTVDEYLYTLDNKGRGQTEEVVMGRPYGKKELSEEAVEQIIGISKNNRDSYPKKVKCIFTNNFPLTKGKIYEVLEEYKRSGKLLYRIKDDENNKTAFFSWMFEPVGEKELPREKPFDYKTVEETIVSSYREEVQNLKEERKALIQEVRSMMETRDFIDNLGKDYTKGLEKENTELKAQLDKEKKITQFSKNTILRLQGIIEQQGKSVHGLLNKTEEKGKILKDSPTHSEGPKASIMITGEGSRDLSGE